MPYGTLAVDTVQSSTANTPPQFNDGNGTQVGTLCRAWVNFNGTSATPITPRANYNVSSVTKSGTGSYVLNFTNALSDANYSVVGSVGPASAGGEALQTNSFTTTTVAIFTSTQTSGLLDRAYVCVAIFR